MKHLNRNHPMLVQLVQNQRIRVKAVRVDPIRNKLRETSGESIAETLVAVLIAAFALLMLAGTVNTSTNLVTKSREVLKEYYEANEVLENMSGNNKYVTPESGGRVTLEGNSVNFTWYNISIYKNTRLQSKPVIAYYKSNMPDGASPTGSSSLEAGE